MDPLIGLHLDLKYTMPDKMYLLDWLRRLPGYGINALLLEYEDKFPYRKYPFLADEEAFTPDELREFLDTARGAGLQVVPLVQTISHLEFALNHPELAHLREAEDMPTQVCPSKPEGVAFVKDLIGEVLAYHEDDALFHLGADEAWHLGRCEPCAAWRERDGVVQMWLQHEKPLMDLVIARGKRPMVWDDIFWNDPELVRTSGLPREVILHAWNYNITVLAEDSTDDTDLEYGGAGGLLPQIEVYNDAGYDSVAAPCINYGQLFPQVDGSLNNTRAWAVKMQRAGMMGMLNTAWAVFHIPLPIDNAFVAATGRLCRDPKAATNDAWLEQWLADEFGARTDGLAQALRDLGEHWFVRVPGWGRPFAPVYGYTNMAAWWPGGQEERRARGAYPVDWDPIDFVALFAKGIAAMRASEKRGETEAEMDRFIANYTAAAPVVRAFAGSATRHTDEAALFAEMADLKLITAQAVSHLVRDDGDAAGLAAALKALQPKLEATLAPFMMPKGVGRMLRVWIEPTVAILRKG